MTQANAESSTLDSGYDKGDRLTHVFCAPCREKHEAKGWRIRALCGATGHAQGDGSASYDPYEDCRVCDDMLSQPCSLCGGVFKWVN